MKHKRAELCRTIGTFAIGFLMVSGVSGQSVAKPQAHANDNEHNVAPAIPAVNDRDTNTERINALEETLRQQAVQLDELRKLLVEQQQTIKLLALHLNDDGRTQLTAASTGTDATAVFSKTTADPTTNSNAHLKDDASTALPQQTPPEDRLKKIEARISELGSIRFSGDIRLRAESFFGLTNTLASADNPSVFGNELSSRHRMRIRARLAVRGSIGPEFDWGLRFATGSFADNISTNQTMTDFFNRKPFSLDQAFITYKPRRAPGLKLQGGRFEAPWTFTEMTLDNDLMVEGFNESYTRTFKHSPFKEVAFVAWQLPFLERNSAFVRNSDGTVNIDQSRRGGRDLALYGGQLRTRLEPSSKVTLSFSIADLYFSGTQFISPIQVFGSNLQIPVTITIPATATTPAQTVTTQVSIPRDLLVAGHGNLGLTTASNNAVNRDGRLASGFNLVDVIGRLELKHSKRFPVSLLLNFVTNTQVHDVVTAGPDGANLLLPNNENHGFWGEFQVGQTRERGNMLFGYTFARVEKDAVLTPFNFSDITQQSDMRIHRFTFGYAADQRVTLSLTGIITDRANGLFGPFVPTPPGSLDRATTRLQFDTMIRF
ncbi:MAG TPA: putative porin [Pyrinomonadaceae bacterium]|nr:putative porin [Pyrinomonadaceae bacterium]